MARTPAHRSPSPVRLAAQLAQRTHPVTIFDIIQQDDALWRALEHAVRAAEAPESLDDPDHTAQETLFEQIWAALPTKDLRMTLTRYNDARDADVMVAQQAGFLVGLELGKAVRA